MNSTTLSRRLPIVVAIGTLVLAATVTAVSAEEPQGDEEIIIHGGDNGPRTGGTIGSPPDDTSEVTIYGESDGEGGRKGPQSDPIPSPRS